MRLVNILENEGATSNWIPGKVVGTASELTLALWYRDLDGDGFGDATQTLASCIPPSGYVANYTDCDDNNAAINPSTAWYLDADNDGYYTGSSVQSCTSPGFGYKFTGILGGGDCDDNNATIHPNASEICNNGIDDNCNGQIDEACTPIVPTINIQDLTVTEKQGLARLNVTLSHPVSQVIKVSYSTMDGTASSKGKMKDYTSAKGMLTFAAGSTSGTIEISIANDGVIEPTGYFNVQLSVGKNVPVNLGKSMSIVTILDGSGVLVRTPEISTKTTKTNSEEWEVIISPNPSVESFKLRFINKKIAGGQLKVFDETGRLIEVKSILPNASEITIGQSYHAGIYWLEISSGMQRKVLKLLKF